MIMHRKAEDRGQFKNHWLESFHSFSFGEYYDPNNMGVSTLRVINDDYIAPRQGFPTHPHNNMEIVTYVLEGALAHKDSMGNGSEILAGDVQKMSAGTGVTHSEYSVSDTRTHLLQIWMLPNEKNVTPSYDQKHFSRESKLGQFKLVVSPDGRDGSVRVHSDSLVHAGLFARGDQAVYELDKSRIAYAHVARGDATINGVAVTAGDSVIIIDEPVSVEGNDGEILLFDLPKVS